MPWARLDDGFHDHPKVGGLSLAAVGLWTLCFTWAHRHMGQPGFIPAHQPRKFGGTSRHIAELVKVGLWDVADGGWMFHDFGDYLPKDKHPASSSEVVAARSEAGKKGARARWQSAINADSTLPSEPMANAWQSAWQDDGKPDGKTMATLDGKSMPPTRPDLNPNLKPKRTAETPDAVSAQTLVGEWLEHCRERPPSRITGQTSREISGLLAEGINPDHIRAGLGAWHAKGAHPSTLASFVNEAMNAQPSGAKRSTTDDRVAAALKLAHQLDQQPQLQIGNR